MTRVWVVFADAPEVLGQFTARAIRDSAIRADFVESLPSHLRDATVARAVRKTVELTQPGVWMSPIWGVAVKEDPHVQEGTTVALQTALGVEWR